MLPSFYVSGDKACAWSVTRAAALGAGVGLVAALFKTLGPPHGPLATSSVSGIAEIGGAVLGFALLCAAAAAVRNFLSRRVIWRDS